MRNEMVTIPITEAETVSGILSIPDSGTDTGIILAHGAAADAEIPKGEGNYAFALSLARNPLDQKSAEKHPAGRGR